MLLSSTVMQRMCAVFGNETAERMLELNLAPLPDATLSCLLVRAGHAPADVQICRKSSADLAAQVGGDAAAILAGLRMVLFNAGSLSRLLAAAGYPSEEQDRILEMSTFRLAWVTSGRPWPPQQTH